MRRSRWYPVGVGALTGFFCVALVGFTPAGVLWWLLGVCLISLHTLFFS